MVLSGDLLESIAMVLSTDLLESIAISVIN